MDREEMFKVFSVLLDECYDRLHRTILLMLREPIDEKEKRSTTRK